MPRFFVMPENIADRTVRITGDDVNHIRKVLRLRPGDVITVCDGSGTDYTAEIKSLEADYVAAAVTAAEKSLTEPPVKVTLFQGIPKSDKMDFIVQKSVELGVARIVPVITERTVVRLDGKRDSEKKRERWQRISLEAAKQCNRGIIPLVEEPVEFDQAVQKAAKSDFAIIPYEKESQKSLRNCFEQGFVSEAAVIIGAEGGFSEKEVELAVRGGVIPVSLGPRILRTETAGLAVLSVLMYRFGDLG